jgi:hypothetical protein
MKRLLFTLLFFSFTATRLFAQHDHSMHNMSMMEDTMPAMHHMDMHEHKNMAMSSAYSLSLPMNRNGSGTSWLPDNAPMYGYMLHQKKWMFMFHGNVFLRYNSQDIFKSGSRGDSKFDAPNWFMAMGQRKVGKNGLFHFSTMFSLDALTIGGYGYPLLFQTGETWKGKPLVDRQHPHDLFDELSVGYTQRINKNVDITGYFGYPGEPALSAATFMHRPSSLSNPDAPLGHHWQDATHITFGVATLGVRYKNWKLEGSSFTGREPDENRYDFDKMKFDSWSGRLSFNPSASWSLQASHAFIKSPEALHPEEDIHRTTASAIYAHRIGNDKLLNAAAVWGYNYVDEHHKENSALAEASYVAKKNTAYGKYEWVQKSAEELNLNEDEYGHDSRFPVHAITAGYARTLASFAKTNISVGAQTTLYVVSDDLKDLYGKTPVAGEIYLRISPGLMR